MELARRDSTSDTFHGILVPDPYRWLEDDDDPEVRVWSERQRSVTEDYLGRIPMRSGIRERLRELWNYSRQSVPLRRGGRCFFSRNEGLQNQPVIFFQDGPDAAPEVLLDPNDLSEDGTEAVTEYVPNEDGSLIAYRVASSGSDWQEIRIRDVGTRSDVSDVLHHCKYSSIAWAHDGSGFFYDLYPAPGTVPAGQEHTCNRLHWHTLGTSQIDDKLVYEDLENPERAFRAVMTEDGKYLLLFVVEGTESNNRIYCREAESNDPFVRLLDEKDASYLPIGSIGSTVYFRTSLGASRGRIVAIDVENPGRENWREILGESEDVITQAKIIGGHLLVCAMRNVQACVSLYSLEGEFIREIPLPPCSSVAELSGRQDDPEMFFTFTSFLQPETVFRYDISSDALTAFHDPVVGFGADGYETTFTSYRSKDGAEIPISVTHRKDIEFDGSHPTLLYGYGGFNIPVTPSFSPRAIQWLEAGGVYAVANLRGGGELGEEWHEAGTFERKQNVFDDFIAAGEWLIESGYTHSERLAINGGSNGGLLVAACMLQRPDLWGAVVCDVPVTDMLRFHLWTGGRYWNCEFGNAEAPEHFQTLYAYSPLHNVTPGAYPPTLVTTADSDDRVVPAHARKFTAALQEAQTGDAPVLLRIESKAGHGQGKPTSKLIEESTDFCAFLFDLFGMKGSG